MNRLLPRPLVVLALAALAALAAACGSSGATAEFKLQDAPPPGVTSVKVTVLAAQAHVVDLSKAKDADPADASIDDDASWVTLNVNRTIDLVAHQGETAAESLGSLDLPAGKITQLRLKLDTSAADRNTLTSAAGTCNLDVSKVEVKGIKINHVFKAFESKAGAKGEVYLDFDLSESLKEDKAGGCYRLEPHLKLHKVKTDGKDETL